MLEQTAGKQVIDLLHTWQVDRIFGMPGDSINELMEELRKQEDIRFIQIRHEETGALAASAHAKLTHQIGVCLSIAGPGAVHLQNGLYDAKKDKVPVLAIVGQISSTMVGTDHFQELKLEAMFEDVGVYNRRVQTAEQLPDMLNQAIRTAYAQKGPAVLIVPDDLFSQKVKSKEAMTSPIYSSPVIRPEEKDLKEATAYIHESKKPAILVGKGAEGAADEVLAFAEKIKAPIIVSLPAKGMIPDDHPHNMGQLGQLGTKPSYEAIQEADLLLLLGTAFPYREFLPENTPAVQIDIDSSVIGKYYPSRVGLIGDLRSILPWFTNGLEEKEDDFLQSCIKKRKSWNDELQQDIDKETKLLQPQQAMAEIQRMLEDDAIVSLDVGSITVWTARYLHLNKQKMIISSWLATMGCSLPGAIAAKLAFPDRQVIGIVGDGGFSMGMQDFVTAVKYKLPIIMVVFNNEKISMIEFEQQAMGNQPEATDISDIDYAAFARACGGIGYTADSREELRHALKQASTSEVPVVIDAHVEHIPPLPGKVSYHQGIQYGQYMIKSMFSKGSTTIPPIKKGLKRL
ncbi:pyruvate oxidase [Sinobaca sp. H24]|uniref:pyruvate oxidase n=1 Tax=Sinobaca sp. H24 TaxID=2923376 RepID=UPI00207A726E|nr:pyruvate oxidase [Sinobaca sp. H24]